MELHLWRDSLQEQYKDLHKSNLVSEHFLPAVQVAINAVRIAGGRVIFYEDGMRAYNEINK